MGKWEFGGRLLLIIAVAVYIWWVWTAYGEEAGRWLIAGYMLAVFVGMSSKH